MPNRVYPLRANNTSTCQNRLCTRHRVIVGRLLKYVKYTRVDQWLALQECAYSSLRTGMYVCMYVELLFVFSLKGSQRQWQQQ